MDELFLKSEAIRELFFLDLQVGTGDTFAIQSLQ